MGGGWLWWRRLRASLLPPTLLSLLVSLKKGTEWVRQLPLMDTDQVTQVTATAKSLQSCLTLCDPIDGSLPGSPIPGILQARTLAWVFQCYSLNLFYPLLLPLCPQIHPLCLHLYSCPANRFISNVSYFLYQFIIKIIVASHSYPQFTI